jgi:hypothetical protein
VTETKRCGPRTDFYGSGIYRPKDGVMVVTEAERLVGRKSMMGLLAVREAAEKEGRELILVASYYEDDAALKRTMDVLSHHGL